MFCGIFTEYQNLFILFVAQDHAQGVQLVFCGIFTEYQNLFILFVAQDV